MSVTAQKDDHQETERKVPPVSWDQKARDIAVFDCTIGEADYWKIERDVYRVKEGHAQWVSKCAPWDDHGRDYIRNKEGDK